jgi:hypothetical protein
MALHHRRAMSRASSHPSGTPVAIQRATGCAGHPLSLEAREGKSKAQEQSHFDIEITAKLPNEAK